MYKRILLSGLAFVCMSLPFAVSAGPLEVLGHSIYNDINLSANFNQACKSCHHPSAGFAERDQKLPVSQGSFYLFGNRNAPTSSYAGFSPRLHWDGELYIGGMFWDGRASGLETSGTAHLGQGTTGDPIADQAKGPFLNPVEHALTSQAQVVQTVLGSAYAAQYLALFGPVDLNNDASVREAYDNIAKAIAAFERSPGVTQFKSKFDKFIAEQGGDVSAFGVVTDPVTGFRKYVGPPAGFKSKAFTYDEADGLALFNADSEKQLEMGDGTNVGGMCYLCHITERHDPAAYGKNQTQPANPLTTDGTYNAVLTDFSYDNLGIPKNALIYTLPPLPKPAVDYGLGDASRVAELTSLNPVMIDPVTGNAVDEVGKFKVSTLRNVALTAPYGHNGYFPDLYSIVHFYNTRDVPWPGETFEPPEVPETVNGGELGKLGLSLAQEEKIVRFLKTLSD